MQLTIDFAVDSDLTLENYFDADNQAVVKALKTFIKPTPKPKNRASSDSHHLLFLHGLKGSGKSHLMQALCQYANEHKLTAQYLPIEAFKHYPPDATLGMEVMDVLLVDDVDLLSGDGVWQTSLFDLINRVLEAGNKIAFTASKPSNECGFTLADLVSRLQWGQVWRLKSLSDNDQIEMMKFRAKCKGMILSDEVATFIYNRLQREAKAIIKCLERLDEKSLQAQRRITVPFIKDVMNW